MGIANLGLVINGFRKELADKGHLPSIIDIINRSSVRLAGIVPYSPKLQASQEAAELSFMGHPRRKATEWEAAFYNIASRICGKRINLFDGVEKPKKRYKYEDIS